MSFAELRQTVLEHHALSTEYFAEEGQVGAPDDSRDLMTVVFKVDTFYETRRGLGANPANESRRGTMHERERIKVTWSRNPATAKSYPGRPQIGTVLYRPEPKDKNRNPFTFRGEVAYEDDQEATYVFERPRVVSQGAGQ